MIEWDDIVVTETWLSKDRRFKIEGQVIGDRRQAYVPFQWNKYPSYGYHSFLGKGGTVAFGTLEETQAFLVGILATEKGN